MIEILAVIGVVLAILLGLMGLAIYSWFSYGYVLSILWSWFILPVFNLPSLSVVQAIGVMIVFRSLSNYTATKEDKEETTSQKVAKVIVGLVWPWLFLGTAWIVKHFIYGN